MSETTKKTTVPKSKSVAAQAEKKTVDADKFAARKLATLALKDGAANQRNATRIVENVKKAKKNRGGTK